MKSNHKDNNFNTRTSKERKQITIRAQLELNLRRRVRFDSRWRVRGVDDNKAWFLWVGRCRIYSNWIQGILMRSEIWIQVSWSVCHSIAYSTYSHLYRNITHFLWIFHFQGFTTIILVEGLLLNIFCFFYFYYHIIFIFTTYLNNITDFIPFPCVAGIPADVHSYMYQLSPARAGQSISNSSATAASATVLYSTLSNRLMIVCLSVS